MTITDAASELLGLAIVGGVAMKILDDEPRHKHKKRKEEKPFKW